MDVKDLTTRYANDVIATCAFGLKIDSSNDDNQFYVMGKNTSSFSLWQLLMMFGFATYPKIMKVFIISHCLFDIDCAGI